jgi:hypothetical protein
LGRDGWGGPPGYVDYVYVFLLAVAAKIKATIRAYSTR